jgi:hypothetical protein
MGIQCFSAVGARSKVGIQSPEVLQIPAGLANCVDTAVLAITFLSAAKRLQQVLLYPLDTQGDARFKELRNGFFATRWSSIFGGVAVHRKAGEQHLRSTSPDNPARERQRHH